MARKLRMEEAGAMYHVINRGNYRRDLFENAGAAEAFLKTLFEAAGKFRWRLYAYVLMRNHFHLAVETVEPTLGEGMHWLQGTMAVRFNRYRQENGHLFQGRYKAMPIEDRAALRRVVDYIHLNPVRAKVVGPEWVRSYRWSSLRVFLKGPRPSALEPRPWLERSGWTDDEAGWKAYVAELEELARNEAAWEKVGVVGLGRGWAIGTHGWRTAMAREYAQTALARGLAQSERLTLRQAAWESALQAELMSLHRDESELASRPRKQAWKIELAARLRAAVGARIAWLARRLDLGKPESLRGYLHQLRKQNELTKHALTP